MTLAAVIISIVAIYSVTAQGRFLCSEKFCFVLNLKSQNKTLTTGKSLSYLVAEQVMNQ